MSCKPLTKKEWQASVAEMWSSAVESTYRDLIEEAVLAEREACAKVADHYSMHDQDTPADIAEAIRARGRS